jgi:hypothetical protein
LRAISDGLGDSGDQWREAELIGVVIEGIVQSVEGDGDDADVALDGHEIGVAVPAGDDVGVDVVWQACACAAADVEPDVEALGFDDGFEEFGGVGHELGEVLEVLLGEVFELAFVDGGGEEEVPAGIGESVEQDEGGFSSPEDVILPISGRVLPVIAKEASGFGFGLIEGLDVFEAPGGPNVLVGFGHIETAWN